MQFHLGYVTETIWNHNFYLPLVCHLTSDLKVFIVYTRRSTNEFNTFYVAQSFGSCICISFRASTYVMLIMIHRSIYVNDGCYGRLAPARLQGSCSVSTSLVLLYPAASGGRVLYLSRFFLLPQFSAYNSNMPELILTILGHNNPLRYRYMCHDQHGVKGSCRGHRVKKVIFH